MAKLKGTIQRSDLEGGMWLLDADDGKQYQLTGETKGMVSGKRAEVEGKVESQQMGFGMGGAILAVRHYKLI